MQIYSYTTKDESGEKHTGKVEARDEAHAVSILRSRNLFVIDLKENTERSALFSGVFGGVKRTDVMAITVQLATMINSGLPLTDALDILRVQSKPALAEVLSELQRDVQGGMGLADAMARHPKVFDGVYVALVRAGEKSGKLDEILERLAQTEERAREFRQKTRGALVYPAIVMTAMVIVVFVMMVFVIPQLTGMYEEFGAELPILTQILIGVSSFMAQFWWAFILGTAAAILGLRSYRKTPHGKEVTDGWLLKLPISGPLQIQLMMAEFARTLSLLVSAGISILEALGITTDVMGNTIFKSALRSAQKSIEKGQPLAATLASLQVFPPLMAQMISVGEETGELEAVLGKVAHYFETEAEQKIKNLTTALEPVIIIVLGIGVGFIVLSIIMPIYNLTSQF